MNRFYTALLCAMLAGMVAHDAGVPLWRDWIPGDVTDIFVTTFYAVFFFIGATRAKVIVNNFAQGTEARRAETGNTDSACDGPVPKECARKSAT